MKIWLENISKTSTDQVSSVHNLMVLNFGAKNIIMFFPTSGQTKSVQDALHVHKGTKSPWQYCNDNLKRIYTHDVTSVVDYYGKLSKAKLRVLIYRYTTKFTKNTDFGLTYATVKGAGHFAAEHKIKECSAMIHRWISYHPL